MRLLLVALVCASLLFGIPACQSREKGTVQGTVAPAAAGCRVVVKGGVAADVTVVPDERTGAFSIAMAPGTYDVAVSSPSSPFPVSFPGVAVLPGKAVSLGTIQFQVAQVRGTGSISGSIKGGGAVQVAALLDGQERAAVSTDRAGRYELKELPAGNYTVKVQSPGYAADARTVGLADGEQASVNIRMLYQTSLDGVDWTAGTIRARGIGSPPPQAPSPTVRRELAKRAALSDAERNMLRIIDMIETGPGQKLSAFLGQASYTRTIEGYLRGFRVAAERDLDGGRIEVEIELPLTGPGGLSSLLPAN